MKQGFEDTLRRVMDGAIASGEQPCASAAIWHEGREVFRYACGWSDIGAGAPFGEDAICRMYSLTKPITAVTVMALIERGDLELLQPVSELLPGFANQRVMTETGEEPVLRPVTIRDLYSMTSGVVYPGEGGPAERSMAALFDEAARQAGDGHPLSTLELMNRVGERPLAFQPGSQWQSGLSADVLGAAAEAATGKPLSALMSELVWEPLGMKDTAFYVPPQKASRLARLYALRDGALTPATDGHLLIWDASAPPAYEAGGAGLFSTLTDILRFGRMLLGRGTLDGARVLSPAGVDWLSHNHLTGEQAAAFNWDSALGYGYGGLMRVLLEPGKSFSLGAAGEFGWDGWTGPYLSVSPGTGTVIALMQQRTDNGVTALTRRLRNAVFGSMD